VRAGGRGRYSHHYLENSPIRTNMRYDWASAQRALILSGVPRDMGVSTEFWHMALCLDRLLFCGRASKKWTIEVSKRVLRKFL